MSDNPRLFDDPDPPRETVYQRHARECAETARQFGAYPQQPGWKSTDTSQEAAQTVPADTLRDRVLEVLSRGPSSADQIAEALHADILAIRPRVSELRVMGRVVDTGQRAYNRSGKRAVVWRRAEHDR